MRPISKTITVKPRYNATRYRANFTIAPILRKNSSFFIFVKITSLHFTKIFVVAGFPCIIFIVIALSSGYDSVKRNNYSCNYYRLFIYLFPGHGLSEASDRPAPGVWPRVGGGLHNTDQAGGPAGAVHRLVQRWSLSPGGGIQGYSWGTANKT